MLALVLENRAVDGSHALDLFLPKIQEDEMLRAALQKAVAIPSKSILFNIDQKADIISKTQIDALLAVFVKVFNEMCGYYGKQGLHRPVRARSRQPRWPVDKFKAAYQLARRQDLGKGPRTGPAGVRQHCQSLQQVTGENPAKGSSTSTARQYRLHRGLCQPGQGLARQASPANFRLNFFVDEVGQYIAENTKLMTNLQTIAESLATKCQGRAWVIVTAQEDMNSPRRDEQAAKQRLHQDPGPLCQPPEAHQRRRGRGHPEAPADQNETAGSNCWPHIYNQQSNNFKTLFDFADGATAPTATSGCEDHFVTATPSFPTSSTCSSRPSRASRCTTASKASKLGRRALHARCVPRGGHRHRPSRSGSWQPSTDVRGHPHRAQGANSKRHQQRRAPSGRRIRRARAQGAVPGQVRQGVQGHAAQPQRIDAGRFGRTFRPCARKSKPHSICWSSRPTSSAMATCTST
jgi:hypothetical protein